MATMGEKPQTVAILRRLGVTEMRRSGVTGAWFAQGEKMRKASGESASQRHFGDVVLLNYRTILSENH